MSEGTKLTFDLAKDISSGGNEAADCHPEIQPGEHHATALSFLGLSAQSIVGKSWDLSKRTFGAGATRRGRHRPGRSGRRKSDRGTGTRQGTAMAAGSVSLAKEISLTSAERSGSTFAFAGNTFVKGYAAVPANLKKRRAGFGESLSEAKLAAIVKEENKTRSRWSQKTVDLMADTSRIILPMS